MRLLFKMVENEWEKISIQENVVLRMRTELSWDVVRVSYTESRSLLSKS